MLSRRLHDGAKLYWCRFPIERQARHRSHAGRDQALTIRVPNFEYDSGLRHFEATLPLPYVDPVTHRLGLHRLDLSDKPRWRRLPKQPVRVMDMKMALLTAPCRFTVYCSVIGRRMNEVERTMVVVGIEDTQLGKHRKAPIR